MAQKVFCEAPLFCGYQTNPPDIFLITVAYKIYEDTGGENNGPRMCDGMSTLYVPLGSGPIDVYAQVFDEIKALAAANGFVEPVKSDIYAFIPHSFSVLLPD